MTSIFPCGIFPADTGSSPGGMVAVMRIVFAADDENECTRAVVGHLREVADLRVLDGGSWPDFARAAGQAVAAGQADYAVLMCWTGTGTSIAANKVPGVRAALAWEPWIARNARLWNDANVLALSLKRLAPDVAVDCVRAFLEVTAEDPDESATIDQIRDL
jgi:ribose 5-phosphate isomerase B